MSFVKYVFDKGMAALQEEHAAKEKEKFGYLRGGSSGLYQGGAYYGTCPRLAYLRQQGIEVEQLGYERQLMFQAGFGNEDLWLDVLKRGLPKGYIVKCEEDIPIQWHTKNDTPVTGRPDMVIFDDKGNANVGIELKLISSLWTARDVGFNLKPKFDHLIQAGHYSWKLGNIPYELWYTSRADFAVGYTWEQNTFPKPSEMPDWMLARLELSVKQDKRTGKEKTTIKKLLPFMQGYELKWHDRGQLMYKPIGPGTDEWQYTPVTRQGIEDYYESVSTLTTLGSKPQNVDVNGEKMSWSKCDYCPLNDLCSKTPDTSSIEAWRSAVLSQLAK